MGYNALTSPCIGTLASEALRDPNDKVLGRSRKLRFMVIAHTATAASHADPNPREGKDNQENHAESDERSAQVNSKTLHGA